MLVVDRRSTVCAIPPAGHGEALAIPIQPYLRSGYLTRGRTLRNLAEKIGVDPVQLEKTVAAFNIGGRGR